MTAFAAHMAWWQWAIAAWVVLCLPLTALLGAGWHRLAHSVRLDDAHCVPVTVVVSARNEARDLPACLASLMALDYPAGKLQVVLVDDHSTDATGAIVDAAAAAHPHVTAVHAAALPPNGLEAKARGIAYGIARATGEWVLITDADATVQPGWVRHMLGRVTSGTGMVGGAVAVEAVGLVGTIERVSWAYTQLYSHGLAGWNAPIVCLGPNMAIRRSVYVEAGGLERADFRVAEDLELFRMVVRRKLGVQTYADRETTATLRPVPSARHLLSQQRRWLGGGMASDAAVRVPLIAAFWWGFGIATYVLFGWALGVRWWLAFIAAKAALDGLALAGEQRSLGERRLVRYLGLLEVYHAFIFFVLAPSFLFSKRIHWMGEGYAVTYE